MPHLLNKTIGLIDGFLTVPISDMLIWNWDSSASVRLSLFITSVALIASYYKTTALAYTAPLVTVAGIPSNLDDQVYKSLFQNVYLLMDLIEVLQQ